jgi:hypothetical protein
LAPGRSFVEADPPEVRAERSDAERTATPRGNDELFRHPEKFEVLKGVYFKRCSDIIFDLKFKNLCETILVNYT